MLTIHSKPKNGTGLLKTRIYPSLDFTNGPNHPPRKDGFKDSATRIEEVSYWNGYKTVTHYEVSTDEGSVDRALQARGQKLLTDSQRLELFNAYEEAGDYDRAIALVDSAASIPDSPMGLSVASNSHNLGTKRGLKGITPYGKRLVRSAAALMEEKHGRRCLTLGTCTLPALEPDELKLVCRSWADLVRKFFQELQRLLIRKGLDSDYIQVTEIQEKRFEKWGQVCPHLHWIIHGRKSPRSDWSIKPHEVRSIWERLLSNLIQRPVDGTAATRIESPRKSLLAELGKYISKGTKIIRAIIDSGMTDSLPSAWWGCSKSLKAQVKQRIIEDCGELSVWLSRNLERLRQEGKVWFIHIYRRFVDRQTGLVTEKHVGTVGRFNSIAVLNEVLGMGSSKACA